MESKTLLQYYLCSIKGHKQDTNKELVSSGNIQNLIKNNLPLVVKLAKKYYIPSPQRIDLIDLIQEGNIGLIEASKRFNDNLGYKFSTYAGSYIEGYIKRYLDNNSRVVRIPCGVIDIKRKYDKLKKEDSELNDDFIFRLIAKENKCTLKRIRHCVKYEQCAFSIDATDEETIITKTIIGEKIHKIDVNYLFSLLKDRERYILKQRMKQYTLEEISEVVGITKERVRQIQEMAIRKLKAIIANCDILTIKGL